MIRRHGGVSRRWAVVVAAGLLTAAAGAGPVTARRDKEHGRVDVAEGETPVLRYHFETVPVPKHLKGRKYAEARSDYIHPLYGPAGEVLTADYPNDHPHHRGMYWAWLEVYFEDADIPYWGYNQGQEPMTELQNVLGEVKALLFAPQCVGKDNKGFLPEGTTDDGFVELDNIEFF